MSSCWELVGKAAIFKGRPASSAPVKARNQLCNDRTNCDPIIERVIVLYRTGLVSARVVQFGSRKGVLRKRFRGITKGQRLPAS